MKPLFYRRVHRHNNTADTVISLKDKQKRQSFFSEPVQNPFFKPSGWFLPQHAIQPKLQDLDSGIQRIENPLEEDKKMEPVSENENTRMQKKDIENEAKNNISKKEESNSQVQLSETDSHSNPGTYINSLNGRGNPMPAGTNAFFSSRFGYDFSKVRLITGREAAISAKLMNAKAYTIGNNIVFGEGQLNTETIEGKNLIAHELAHVVQQGSENEVTRKKIAEPGDKETEKEEITFPAFFERGIIEQNTRHKANCSGVSVEGYTDANYSHSFSALATSKPVNNCTECVSEKCVENKGTLISVFRANPQITLPSVPAGLNRCEQIAVRRFINTTLRAHEREHVAAFNTYRGTIRTPFTYRGCESGADAYIQQIHDTIETSRRSASDAASAALDAGGANNFTITCNCP